MIKVIKVLFGDWSENYVENSEWGYWNEWYGYKDKIDEKIDILESNNMCGDDEVIDVKKIMSDVSCVKWGELMMDVSGDEFDEFSFSVFNVDEFKKLGDKIVKIGDGGVFSVMEDDGSIEWKGMWCNGEVSDECEYMMLSDDDMKVFKMIKYDEKWYEMS